MAEETPQQSQEENIDPIQLFTPAVQTVVEGLAYLGRLNETVTLAGHRFGLQTLRPEYRYAIGQVIQPYRNTLIEVDAWEAAHVGAALTHVDGNSHFCDAIGPSIEEFVQGRFRYVTNSDTGWYKPTLDFLFIQYNLLELKASKAVEQLNFLSQKTSIPQEFLQGLEAILSESASLPEEMNGASLPFPSSSEL